MNSLSDFSHSEFPLKEFLSSVSAVKIPGSILVFKHKKFYRIILPSRKCFIGVYQNTIVVERIGEKFAFGSERKSVYRVDSVEQAKPLTGILSGVCYEHGCSTYNDADATVKMIYHFLNKTSYGVV